MIDVLDGHLYDYEIMDGSINGNCFKFNRYNASSAVDVDDDDFMINWQQDHPASKKFVTAGAE